MVQANVKAFDHVPASRLLDVAKFEQSVFTEDEINKLRIRSHDRPFGDFLSLEISGSIPANYDCDVRTNRRAFCARRWIKKRPTTWNLVRTERKIVASLLCGFRLVVERTLHSGREAD
jgi:hypothetical protein